MTSSPVPASSWKCSHPPLMPCLRLWTRLMIGGESSVITPALMTGMDDIILDRISFGGVKELQEIYESCLTCLIQVHSGVREEAAAQSLTTPSSHDSQAAGGAESAPPAASDMSPAGRRQPIVLNGPQVSILTNRVSPAIAVVSGLKLMQRSSHNCMTTCVYAICQVSLICTLFGVEP